MHEGKSKGGRLNFPIFIADVGTLHALQQFCT